MVFIYKSNKIQCNPVTFGNGHRVSNSPYNIFKKAIKNSLNQQGTFKINNYHNIGIEIVIYITEKKSNKSDLDNYLKPIIDALSEQIGFEEPQISKICITKQIVKQEGDEGIECAILCM